MNLGDLRVANEKVLVIEDEPDIRELIGYNLRKNGYTVVEADSGEQGLKAAETDPFDVILLDLRSSDIFLIA